MRHKPGSRLREIFSGWTGLDWLWLTLLIAGTIGVGLLDTRGLPDVASADPQQPSVQRTSAPAIVPIVWEARPHVRSEAPARPAMAGATAASPGNSEDPHTGAAAIPTASPPHTGSSPVQEPRPPAGPVRALRQVAMGNPAASSAVAESGVGEDVTNSGAHPVGRERVVIHYLVGSRVADAAAKRLRTRLGGRAEMREEATVPQSALVRYASSDDHSAAREAGKILGEMDYPWKIETTPNRPGDSSQGVIKIWLPDR